VSSVSCPGIPKRAAVVRRQMRLVWVEFLDPRLYDERV
jgi:hypothetical protein